jgi:hypothetical protein
VRLASVVRRTNGTIITKWPTIIKVKEGLIPSSEKYIRAAKPKAMPGKIRGDINSVSAALDQRERVEEIPIAAQVPSNAAAPAAQHATSNVLKAALCICLDSLGSNSFSYHCKENP